MKKILSFNFLCLAFLSLNLTAENLTPGTVAEVAYQTNDRSLGLISQYNQKIIEAKLSCDCRNELYNAIADLPGSEVFKPASDCVSSNDITSESEKVQQLINEVKNKDSENLVEQYLNRLEQSEISTECLANLSVAIRGLPTK